MVWEPISQEFRFNNSLTGEKRLISTDRKIWYNSSADESIPPVQGDCNLATRSPLPDQTQKKVALETALKDGYSNRIDLAKFSDGTKYGSKRRIILVRYGRRRGEYLPQRILVIPSTLLASAVGMECVDNGNTELVERCSSQNGADANFSTFPGKDLL